MITIILILFISLGASAGQFFLKQSLDTVAFAGKSVPEIAVAALQALFLHPKGWAAILLIGTSSLLYFVALRLGQLSIVAPMTAGLIIAFTALLGWFVMKDAMPAIKIFGLLLISTGIILVSRSA